MKAKQETLQPLTIYGNTLTPRSRREMSDLQYYSKLPPIPPESAASQNVGDVDAPTDVNQELAGDITLDLGDIEVSCVTERNGHDASYIGEEEGDQQYVVNIHTSTNTTENSGYPENYTGASVSIGLDPSPRTGHQNPALLNGALPTSNDPKDFQEAKVLSTLSEVESPESVVADLQNEKSFKNVTDCRVEVKASDISQPSDVHEVLYHRTVHGINSEQAKTIMELPEDDTESTDPIRTEFDELKSTSTERTRVKQPDDTNTGKITVTVTAPSIDIDDFSTNDDVLIKADDVSSKADDVSASNDDSKKHDEVFTKNNDVSLILDDDDNESENSCDDEGIYTTDILDYDDDDDDESDVNLMTIEEEEEQRLWDLEFDKRKEQIVLDQQKIETRRKDFQSKLNNLTDRWNGIEARLENRQIEKRHQLYEQLQQLVTLHKRS